VSEAFEAVASAIEARASELPGVDRRVIHGLVEFQRTGRPFARIAPDGFAFRLEGRVASAARATPGTGPSSSGADWILFRPSIADRSSLDRATAWLELAWRRATTGGRPASPSGPGRD
jgi:hypothetical protein